MRVAPSITPRKWKHYILWFGVNTHLKLRGVDYYIEEDKKEKYQSKREVIIEQYLYKDETHRSNF
jgi:hypothetical protein